MNRANSAELNLITPRSCQLSFGPSGHAVRVADMVDHTTCLRDFVVVCRGASIGLDGSFGPTADSFEPFIAARDITTKARRHEVEFTVTHDIRGLMPAIPLRRRARIIARSEARAATPRDGSRKQTIRDQRFQTYVRQGWAAFTDHDESNGLIGSLIVGPRDGRFFNQQAPAKDIHA